MIMKKIKVILIGVGHDHAPAVYSSVMNQDVFDVLGFAVPDVEKITYKDRVESYKKHINYFEVEDIMNCDADAAIIETEEENLTKY